MKFSQPDVLQILMHAVGGFVLAGAFTLGNVASRKKVGDKLLVETKALQVVDETLRVFLFEIQSQTNDTVCFMRLVGSVERVLDREMQIEMHRDKIAPNVRACSKQDYTVIRNDHIPRLYASFKEAHPNDTPKLLDFQVLLTQVVTRVYKHLERIWILTEHSKQNE